MEAYRTTWYNLLIRSKNMILTKHVGVAHYTTSADTYRGYYIPANTIVIGNSWLVLFFFIPSGYYLLLLQAYPS